MKANELMLADWVHIASAGNAQVVMVDQYHVQTTYAKYLIDERKLEPILVTEAIFEANEFDKPVKGAIADYRLYYNNYTLISAYFFERLWRLEIKVDCDPFVSLKPETLSIRIQFVHELQHALRLMGLTDLADNFKIE